MVESDRNLENFEKAQLAFSVVLGKTTLRINRFVLYLETMINICVFAVTLFTFCLWNTTSVFALGSKSICWACQRR